MSQFKFHQSDPNFLIPQKVGDLIPEDDIAWVIMEVVDRLDVSKIACKYSQKGCDGYHPKLLLKLIFYGVASGNRSSRKIARLAQKDIGGIMLGGGQKPSWRTVARFLKDNREEVKALFLQVLELCIALKMVNFGHFSLDGTKVKANAFSNSSLKAETIQKRINDLVTEIEQAFTEVKSNDQTENKVFRESTPDELPKEISFKQERLKKLEEALKELEIRAETNGQPLKPDDRYNFTDPDSRLMKTSRSGFQQAYNHQVMIDGQERVIVAYTTGQQSCDAEELEPAIKETEENIHRYPEILTADKGYYSGKNLEQLEETPIDAYICLPEEEGPFLKDNFRYDADRDLYICPNDREMSFQRQRRKRKDTLSRIYWGDCSGCPYTTKCIKSKTGRRQVERNQYDPLREKMRAKFKTEEGKEIYGRRKELSEPVFGQLKQQQNFHQHLLRGLAEVNSELGLVCMVYNIKRIWHKFKDLRGLRNGLGNMEQRVCPD